MKNLGWMQIEPQKAHAGRADRHAENRQRIMPRKEGNRRIDARRNGHRARRQAIEAVG